MSPLDQDKETFLWNLIEVDWKPEMWWDEDYCELSFEWIDNEKNLHAVVTLDGDGRYNYWYLKGKNFIKGDEFMPLVSRFPDDLKEYLNGRN